MAINAKIDRNSHRNEAEHAVLRNSGVSGAGPLPKYGRGWKKSRTAALPDPIKTLLAFLVPTAVGLLLQMLQLDESNIMMIYLIGVLVTASITGRRLYSVLYSVASLISYNYFFTMPRLSFSAYDPGYPMTFLIMFIMSLLAGNLVNRIRNQRQKAETIALHTSVLLETDQLLLKQKNEAGIASAAAKQISKLTGKTVCYYTADEENGLRASAVCRNDVEHPADSTAGELQTARRVLSETSDTMPVLDRAGVYYFPVRTPERSYGVVGVSFGDDLPDAFACSLITSILGECALALEKEYYNRIREETAVRAENERMRADLLRSISHDLRTPLTSISGSARVLMTAGGTIGEERKQELYTDIHEEAVWLIDVVENLLSITRVEGNGISLHTGMELVDDVIGEALRHANNRTADHKIRVEQDDFSLLARMDARLIVQVLVNLVNNAVRYTPPGSEIVIRAEQKKDCVVFEVADNGNGIPDVSKDRIFDMFYTLNAASSDGRRSLGLGLALCKSIVQAHGGTIAVRDNVPHGAVFSFTLPASGRA